MFFLELGGRITAFGYTTIQLFPPSHFERPPSPRLGVLLEPMAPNLYLSSGEAPYRSRKPLHADGSGTPPFRGTLSAETMILWCRLVNHGTMIANCSDIRWSRSFEQNVLPGYLEQRAR